MNRSFEEYLSAHGSLEEAYSRRIENAVTPALEKLAQRYEEEERGKEQEAKVWPGSLLVLLTTWSSSYRGWIAGGVAIASITVVLMLLTQEAPGPAQAPSPGSFAVEQVPETDLADLGKRLDDAQQSLLLARQKAVSMQEDVVSVPAHNVKPLGAGANIAKAKTNTARITPAFAMEFVRQFDLLLVLDILKDLDVLVKWSGSRDVGILSPFPWYELFLIQSVRAEEFPRRLLLSNDFLDQMYEAFPDIPLAEQAKFTEALARLRAVWDGKKVELAANYETWKQSPPEKQKIYRARFETWKSLPKITREQVLAKYERWKSLSPNEQARIRKRLLERKS